MPAASGHPVGAGVLKPGRATREQRAGRAAAAIYLPASVGAALLFALVAAQQGRAGPAAVIAGAAWVGLLVLIVLMPLVIPAVRRRSV